MQTPEELRKKALRRWPEVLTALVTQRDLGFPWRFSFGAPKGSELLGNFQAVLLSLKSLRLMAAGANLKLEETLVRHRQLGDQQMPVALVIEDLAAYLGWLGLASTHEKLWNAVQRTTVMMPSLGPWLEREMLTLERHLAVWPEILNVLQAFVAKPRPGCYVRELDIAGVDSKFVEAHRHLLNRLLVEVLPAAAFEGDRDVATLAEFCAKFGLKWEQPLVRWRWLDPRLAAATAGLEDLSVPVQEFCRWVPPAVDVIVITENKTSGLSFPRVERGMVVFGLGYGVQSLAQASWMRERRLIYWGDIDTHGFAILARLREHFSHVESLLMDEETLLAGRAYWVSEREQVLAVVNTSLLTASERVAYEALREHRHGDSLRLEQEKIPCHRVSRALAAMLQKRVF